MAESAPPPANSVVAKDGDDIADFVNRLIDYLAYYTDKLPFALDRQKLHSVTTLAALVIALVFLWKLFRPLQEQQRRPRRRTALSSSNASQGMHLDDSPSSDCSSTLKSHETVNHSSQQVNLGLAQLVRRKLNSVHKVTCQLLGIILEETTPEELQIQATVRKTVIDVLQEIAKICDVYLMEQILDDESGEIVLAALTDAGIFSTCGLSKDKVLFCSTELGRISFVRQLEPDWHVDTDKEIVHQLSRFIKFQLHISTQGTERAASNVCCATSLEQYLGD